MVRQQDDGIDKATYLNERLQEHDRPGRDWEDTVRLALKDYREKFHGDEQYRDERKS